MKKVWIWIGSIVGLLVIAVVIFIAVSAGNMQQVDGISSTPEEMPIMVQQATEQELNESILVTGEIVPEEEQKVYLEPEKGEIVEYRVEENKVVQAGETLFVYDTAKIDADINKAAREKGFIQRRAQMEKDQLAQMDKQIADAKKNEQPPEVITEMEKEKLSLEMQVESTQSEIDAAQEQINQLDAQKKEMEVKSKINGIVVKVDKNVAKTENGSQAPVVHIISNEPFKVIGKMSEFDTVKVQPNQEVTVIPKVFKDRQWKGVVESISHYPEESGGGEGMYPEGGGGSPVTMYPFKVAITDDTSELRQGFHVTLEVKTGSNEKRLVVPAFALWEEFGTEDAAAGQIVYVLNNGVLERRDVETGAMSDEFVEILSGVSAGELVVLGPTEEMYDGMEVSQYDEIE
ncbi:HlyD family efflux transporter periplasmic adaptor subunit [Bacillaceae bacterium Marseille-Q3522]|nr:HlyD family efflux transporter periplasmic adaptor subunit [Bacillaceae bacterium Marseille-Q3522]